jgi:hypothetical protein
MANTAREQREKEKIRAALAGNRDRRADVGAQLAAVQAELVRLLARGDAAGLTVSEMARTAGISRVIAHKHLRKKRDA